MLSFESDYTTGAHPEILKRLLETNMDAVSGYGTDPDTKSAMDKIKKECELEDAQVYFAVGDTLSYRWFLGYGLLDNIPHFATVSYAFCNRFPEELSEEIFDHILNKALNNRMVFLY